ncbi:hypothetical protein [Polaromonas sp. CG9_12]|nr:hypothetical protein [Polaromonas sp. CG9_12]
MRLIIVTCADRRLPRPVRADTPNPAKLAAAAPDPSPVPPSPDGTPPYFSALNPELND